MPAKITLFCCLVAVAGGCVHPGQLSRPAHYNRENISHLTEAHRRLVADYEKKLTALLQIQQAIYVARAQDVINEYWDNAAKELLEENFRRDVNDVRKAFDIQTRLADPEKRESVRRQLALEQPLLGDVVAQYLSEEEARLVVEAYGEMIGKSGAYARSTREYAAGQLYLLKRFYVSRDDIIDSLRAYAQNAAKMCDEADRAADAFVEFSRSRTGLADAVKLLTGADVKETIAEIVLARTGDAERREAAEQLLEEMNTAKPAVDDISAGK